MPTVIDQLNQVDFISSFAEPNTAYYAQTFRAAGSALDSVEFLIDTGTTAADASEFRLLITTVSVAGGQFDPGIVLFESALLVDPADAEVSYTLVKVDTSKVALTPGAVYAFILDAFSGFDGVPSVSRIGSSHENTLGTDYTDGFFAFHNALGGDRAAHFDANWSESPGIDLAFRLTFSNPGETIQGNGKKNVLDGTPDDDLILGKANKDTLSGLAGDDVIDGGKHKDKLFGGADDDSFRLGVSFNEKPDKVMDFIPADDTIVLKQKIFKKLPLGVLSDAAFRDVGEAATDADRIRYKANGDLLYDKTGNGSGDAKVFAKLTTKPDIDAADILVAA
jgi:hypothetical protein